MASKNYLAQLVALFRSGGGATSSITGPLGRAADTASVSAALSTEDVALLTAISGVEGTTAGAAVVTDANGTIQQYLRGLIKLWIAGGLGVDTELATAVALADALTKPTTAPVGAWLVGYNGASGDLVRVQSKSYDMNAIAITTIATVATPAGGKQIRLMSGTFSVSAACSVLFENNAGGTTVFRTPLLLANVPYSFDLGNGVLVTTADHVLKATASTGTVTITGTLRGVEE